ncbi:hypothetical protein PHYBOEH_004709 [Phytophthora boehmeriae]|uniref:Uncharacterized protein n=1 Tax=Phytophthora boehmeriae TaxID=109152 RepID=A0A8T1WMX0_9STRA|nr:hypothetical protein PHYBOEH_004709 [Phytophthora boehmeriae]
MHRLPFLMFAALSFAAKVPLRVSATTFAIETYFGGAACGGTPYLVNANEAPDCAAVACKSSDYSRTNSTPQSVGMVSVECTTDYLAALRKKFGSSPYIIQVLSPDSGCATFGTASGFPATGNCEGSFDANDSMGVHLVGTLEPNGSATMQYFSGSPCISSQWFLTESVDSEALAKHSCEASRHRCIHFTEAAVQEETEPAQFAPYNCYVGADRYRHV